MIRLSARLCACALLASAVWVGGGIVGVARAASPASAAPEVIAPEQLPQLTAIRPDGGPAIAVNAPAPMPDADATAPIAAPTEGPLVAPTMFFPKTEFNGNGMTPGSADHARAVQPATGVALELPLN